MINNSNRVVTTILTCKSDIFHKLELWYILTHLNTKIFSLHITQHNYFYSMLVMYYFVWYFLYFQSIMLIRLFQHHDNGCFLEYVLVLVNFFRNNLSMIHLYNLYIENKQYKIWITFCLIQIKSWNEKSSIQSIHQYRSNSVHSNSNLPNIIVFSEYILSQPFFRIGLISQFCTSVNRANVLPLASDTFEPTGKQKNTYI